MKIQKEKQIIKTSDEQRSSSCTEKIQININLKKMKNYLYFALDLAMPSQRCSDNRGLENPFLYLSFKV